MKKLKIHISGISSISSNTLRLIEDKFKIEYVTLDSNKQLQDSLITCDVFWFRLNHNLTRAVLSKAKCKFIVCAVTGLDHIDVAACRDFGISVISLKNEVDFLKEVRATAEHTIGLMLTLIRRTKNAYSHVESGNWDRTLFEGSELYNKKIGILGFGRLGEIVANYTKAFGMQVYYYDINDKQTDIDYISCASIEELCSKVDILSIHLPYNSDTHFVLDKSLFNVMHENAIIIKWLGTKEEGRGKGLAKYLLLLSNKYCSFLLNGDST